MVYPVHRSPRPVAHPHQQPAGEEHREIDELKNKLIDPGGVNLVKIDVGLVFVES